MLSREERFNKWRDNEQPYLDSALQFDTYLKSIDTVKTIQEDFQTKDSPKYKEFASFKYFTFSALLNYLFNIEELQAYLTSNPNEEMLTNQSELLSSLIEKLQQLYCNPRTNTLQNLSVVVELSKQLLSKDFQNPDIAKKFYFALYALLAILSIYLDNLGWYSKPVSIFAGDPQELKKKITEFQKITELRILQFEDKLRVKNPPQIYEFFIKRYITVLENQDTVTQLPLILQKDEQDLKKLFSLKEQQSSVGKTISRVSNLYESIEENDNKWTGQENFTTLIKSDHQIYLEILENTEKTSERELKELHENYQQLNAPGKVNNAIDVILRFAPKSAQNLPISPDRCCKNTFKKIASAYKTRLEKKSDSINSNIDRIIIELAGDNEALKNELIRWTDIESLVSNHKSIQDSLNQYLSVLDYSNNYQNKLDRYIDEKKGFWVSFSNLLAYFCRCFKSFTASGIDKARDTKRKIQKFNLECLNYLKQGGTQKENLKDYFASFQYKCQAFIHAKWSLPNTSFNNSQIWTFSKQFDDCVKRFQSNEAILQNEEDLPFEVMGDDYVEPEYFQKRGSKFFNPGEITPPRESKLEINFST